MDSKTFRLWFQESFLKQIGRSRPVLLVIDPASSHFDLEVLQLAMKENIHVVSLPAKTSNFLQPVDQIVSPLKARFANEAYKCSLVKASFIARPAQFPQLLRSALSAWTPSFYFV